MWDAMRGHSTQARPDTYKVYMITREDQFGSLEYEIEVQGNRDELQNFRVSPGEIVRVTFLGLGKVVREDHASVAAKQEAKSKANPQSK